MTMLIYVGFKCTSIRLAHSYTKTIMIIMTIPQELELRWNIRRHFYSGDFRYAEYMALVAPSLCTFKNMINVYEIYVLYYLIYECII